MNAFDLTPLFRSTVGFERLNSLFDELSGRGERETSSYPPYNIEKIGEEKYQITMAVAGFSEDDIEITYQENSLIVRGRILKEAAQEKRAFLHRGIANRAFEHKFQLADHIRVVGADLKNGLLEVYLLHEVPEALKPQTIQIGETSEVKKLKKKQA